MVEGYLVEKFKIFSFIYSESWNRIFTSTGACFLLCLEYLTQKSRNILEQFLVYET